MKDKTMTLDPSVANQQGTPKFKDVAIVRDGTKIVLPEGMSYAEGRTWLSRQEESEEKNVAIHDEMRCFPLDGCVAVRRAMESRYGFTAMKDTPTMFGPKPPVLVQVPLADGTFETAILGRMQPPMWEGGYIDCVVPQDMKVVITGQIKKKFESEVKEIITKARELLKDNSIYKGKAVRIDLSWMDGDRDFAPIDDAPQFWNVSNAEESQLILNSTTHFDLRSNVFLLLERTDACQKNDVPLKHGALFAGPFGTGKTMTAKVIANKAVRNGWTYLYLKSVRHLAAALRLAQLYAPAVLFAEDVDQVTAGGRDEDLNTILNTLDGVDTKDQPIITILTTNNIETIQPAFMRAGRIDTIVQFTAPDAATAQRFVNLYAMDDDGHSLLEAGIDLTEAGQELSGMVPAFITEVVQKAKRYALHNENVTDIRGKLKAEYIVQAARSLKAHVALVTGCKQPTVEERVAQSARNLFQYQIGREAEVHPVK